MVRLTRLSGEVVVINADIIERVEPTPDSVVTLINGSRFVVKETIEQIVDAVRLYRSEIYRGVFYPAADGAFEHTHLHIYESPTLEE